MELSLPKRLQFFSNSMTQLNLQFCNNTNTYESPPQQENRERARMRSLHYRPVEFVTTKVHFPFAYPNILSASCLELGHGISGVGAFCCKLTCFEFALYPKIFRYLVIHLGNVMSKHPNITVFAFPPQ